MIKRRTFFATVAAVALALLVPVAPGSAAEPYSDWITVDRVLVNKLGGVSVSGLVSCQGTYDDLVAEKLGYWTWDDETEQDVWVPIPKPGDGDQVNIFLNADQYVVSQPAGRRMMIQVEHGSSRANPCFAQYRYSTDGTPWPDSQECTNEAVCRWETDRYGYDRDTYGPLFDYSPDGKFKVGNLNVTVGVYGSFITIHHGTDPATGWDVYGLDFTPDIYTSQVVKAVAYR